MESEKLDIITRYFITKEKLSNFYWKMLLSLGVWIIFFSSNLKEKYFIMIYFSAPLVMIYFEMYQSYFIPYQEAKKLYFKCISEEEKKKIEDNDIVLKVGVIGIIFSILGIFLINILLDFIKVFI